MIDFLKGVSLTLLITIAPIITMYYLFWKQIWNWGPAKDSRDMYNKIIKNANNKTTGRTAA
jgi:hypothetical protein